eukprot:TRINITY_DN28719_c0_g1_i1.p1 TRINITY_DN28719_c0_g1~~TRINITY_DN28719_c0_g1_i1.p1  ORF type:complete len:474 (+),score=42.84 TRINITY_DN28719_c0_g1_i1:72-1424(+)
MPGAGLPCTFGPPPPVPAYRGGCGDRGAGAAGQGTPKSTSPRNSPKTTPRSTPQPVRSCCPGSPMSGMPPSASCAGPGFVGCSTRLSGRPSPGTPEPRGNSCSSRGITPSSSETRSDSRSRPHLNASQSAPGAYQPSRQGSFEPAFGGTVHSSSHSGFGARQYSAQSSPSPQMMPGSPSAQLGPCPTGPGRAAWLYRSQWPNIDIHDKDMEIMCNWCDSVEAQLAQALPDARDPYLWLDPADQPSAEEDLAPLTRGYTFTDFHQEWDFADASHFEQWCKDRSAIHTETASLVASHLVLPPFGSPAMHPAMAVGNPHVKLISPANALKKNSVDSSTPSLREGGYSGYSSGSSSRNPTMDSCSPRGPRDKGRQHQSQSASALQYDQKRNEILEAQPRCHSFTGPVVLRNATPRKVFPGGGGGALRSSSPLTCRGPSPPIRPRAPQRQCQSAR